MNKIFINYRQDDSSWSAQALYQELINHFPKDSIFKDFNTIAPGEDFVESIGHALEECNVLLILIGEKWLTIEDKKGNRRIDNPNDYVRLEIATALKRNIKVIPVLFDDAFIPEPEDLPDDIRKITTRQYIEIDKKRFDTDTLKLVNAIQTIFTTGNKAKPVIDANQLGEAEKKEEKSLQTDDHERIINTKPLGLRENTKQLRETKNQQQNAKVAEPTPLVDSPKKGNSKTALLIIGGIVLVAIILFFGSGNNSDSSPSADSLDTVKQAFDNPSYQGGDSTVARATNLPNQAQFVNQAINRQVEFRIERVNDNFFRLSSVLDNNCYENIEFNSLLCSGMDAVNSDGNKLINENGGWISAFWSLEKQASGYYIIRNAWKTDQAMYMDGVELKCGTLQEGDQNFLWSIQ